MALTVNLRQLEKDDVRLKGELAAGELDLGAKDEMVQPEGPLEYDFEARKLDKSLLVQGQLALDLDCKCVRCLKPFVFRLELPEWACHLALEGEESVPVANDSVDLTPAIREDILLALPPHPVCRSGCGGLPARSTGKARKSAGAAQTKEMPSAWSELNKLKF
jgi:uncharacterized protein